MTDLRKAAEMALDALRLYVTMYPQMDKCYMVEARETLRQALAQDEPVALNKNMTLGCPAYLHGLAKPEQEPVNTMPTKIFSPNLEQILNAAGFYKREWVGLTDDEINDFGKKLLDNNDYCSLHFAWGISAKLKEKNERN